MKGLGTLAFIRQLRRYERRQWCVVTDQYRNLHDVRRIILCIPKMRPVHQNQ